MMKIPFLVLAATCLLNVFVTGQGTRDITLTTLIPFTCPGSGFYPFSDECSQFYYYCDEDGLPTLEVCPGSAVYDPIYVQCTDIDTACCNPLTTSVCTTTPLVTTITDITTTDFDRTTDCSSTMDFDTTTDFSSTMDLDRTTDFSSTMDFDTTTDFSSATDSSTTTTRTTGNPSDFTCPQFSGNFPYEGDCTKYWACSNGTPYEMNCPAPLVFNPRKSVCDYVSNVPECQ